MRIGQLAPLLLGCMLAACENSGASFMIGGDKEHSISLLREQRWFWGSEVEQKLIVARFPACQQRYAIASAPAGQVALELYAVSDMLFVLHQGSNWWAVGTERCELQRFDTPPEERGELQGRFDYRNDRLVFVPQQP